MSQRRKLTPEEKKVIRERERAKYPKMEIKVYIDHFTDVRGEPIVRVYRAKPKEIYPPKSRSGA